MIYASAPGKVNLFFEVGAAREDGYHSVLSLYQSLAIRQTVGVEPADNWQVETTGNLPQQQLDLVPANEANLVVIAAKALAEYVDIASPQPMRFETHKEVPVAAGLAGGSADAAAALVALNEAWCLGLSAEQLSEVGAKVGSDVPFALLGGTAIGVDTGIELTSLPPLPKRQVVLVVSPFGLSTGSVFQKFDELFPEGDLHQTKTELAEAVASGTLRFGRNSLMPAALAMRPELADLVDQLQLPVMLSGSGPTLALITESAAEAESWAEKVETAGQFAIKTTTDSRGAALD